MFYNASKKVKFVFFVFALGMTGYLSYPLLDNGIDINKNVVIQISGPISMFFLALALYLDIYIYKNFKEK
jgi:hypothetical protein